MQLLVLNNNPRLLLSQTLAWILGRTIESFYYNFGRNSEKLRQQVETSTRAEARGADGPRELLIHLCTLCSVLISRGSWCSANMPFTALFLIM